MDVHKTHANDSTNILRIDVHTTGKTWCYKYNYLVFSSRVLRKIDIARSRLCLHLIAYERREYNQGQAARRENLMINVSLGAKRRIYSSTCKPVVEFNLGSSRPRLIESSGTHSCHRTARARAWFACGGCVVGRCTRVLQVSGRKSTVLATSLSPSAGCARPAARAAARRPRRVRLEPRRVAAARRNLLTRAAALPVIGPTGCRTSAWTSTT
jgi:hypothetical protein